MYKIEKKSHDKKIHCGRALTSANVSYIIMITLKISVVVSITNELKGVSENEILVYTSQFCIT